MNMMNTQSENRFVRKDLAVAIALVIVSFSATNVVFAESTPAVSTGSSEPLPTLVDPAGVINPELLEILNNMSNTADFATSDVPDEIANQVKQQRVERERTDEPSLGAAQSLFPELESSTDGLGRAANGIENALTNADESPSTVGQMSAIKENLAAESLKTSDDSERESDAKSKAKDIGVAENTTEAELANESLDFIDPHLPPPEIPKMVLKGETLQTLRFADMLALSLVGNPGVVMAEERVQQAIENSKQIGAFRYPKVAAVGTFGPELNDTDEDDESGVSSVGKNVKLSITQQIYDGGTARASFNRAKRLIGAAEAESQIELESLLSEIVVHYIDYWRYQVELSQAEEFVSVMNDLVDKLNSMYRAGAVSKLEVDFARARVASARGARTEAAASMNNAFSELEYLVPGLANFTADSPDKFSDFVLLTLDEYLEKGAAANSGFRTNQMNIEATELKVRASKGLFKPTVNVEVSGSYIEDEGQPSPYRTKAAAKFLLNYTLYSGGERRAAVRRAEAQLREFQSERVQMERNVFRDIDQSFNNITASRLALDAVIDEIIAHEELQRMNRQNLALGTVNIMELIDVEERLFNASSRKNEVLATMYQEYFTLLISSGFTEEILAKYDVQMESDQ